MRRPYWFTVTASQDPQGPGCIQVMDENTADAREIMHSARGARWSFQYDDFTLIHPLDQKIITIIQ